MEILGGIAIAVISTWVGTRLQARATRRRWQDEHGVGAWRNFVTGIHHWRQDLDTIERLEPHEQPSPKMLKRMRQRVWDLSPEAPALYVFAPPAVNRPAMELLRLASEITETLARGDALPTNAIAKFDRLKWEFVTIAAGEFGPR